MSRAKTGGKYVNIYMDQMISDAIGVYSAKTHIPKMAISEEEIKLHLEKNRIKVSIFYES